MSDAAHEASGAPRQAYRIDALGHQGDGIAHADGKAIFVPFALPGETVAIGAGGALDVLEPSATRVAAACPHFGVCGGCVAQHMDEATYNAWKQGIVADAFAQHGFAQPPVQPLVRCGSGSRRRAVFTARRTGGGVVVGYHGRRSHDLIPIQACVVLEPGIVQALPHLRAMVEALEVADARITVLATRTGLDVALAADLKRLPAKAATALPALASLARAARVSFNAEPAVVRSAPALQMGPVTVKPPPGAFVQAVSEAEDAMRRAVSGALGKARRVADLFCGLGTFAYAAAEQARVLAVDSDKAAIAALEDAVRHAQGLKPVETLPRDLLREPLSPLELRDFDAVILDPPRAGAQAQAEALSKSSVPTICYISCNPATLARDARLLASDGYSLESVVPIDQFLYAAHVEAVAVLRRAGGKKGR